MTELIGLTDLTGLTVSPEPTILAFSVSQGWHSFWHSEIGVWITDKGLRIVLLLLGSVLAARLINWTAKKITRRFEEQFQSGDALVRSEASKHRQAVASVISWGSIVLLFVMVAVQITNIIDVPVGSLVAPAAVLGGALGFGAQKLVQDLLSGFFLLLEKQYGFGDLVRLELPSTAVAEGTVEDVTLRVTKLRTADGEVYTVPNGQIINSLNLSKDWARAVVDIPVPTRADFGLVNEVLHEVCDGAMDNDAPLRELLLDKPALMGVESIEVDTVNLRMVARTLPGKQFEVGRRLRAQVLRALGRAGVGTVGDVGPRVAGIAASARVGAEPEPEPDPGPGNDVDDPDEEPKR